METSLWMCRIRGLHPFNVSLSVWWNCRDSSSRWNNNCKKVLRKTQQSQCGYFREKDTIWANRKGAVFHYDNARPHVVTHNLQEIKELKSFIAYLIFLNWLLWIFIGSDFYRTNEMTKNVFLQSGEYYVTTFFQ